MSGYCQTKADSAPIVVSPIKSFLPSTIYPYCHFCTICQPTSFENTCFSFTKSLIERMLDVLEARTCSFISLIVFDFLAGLLLGVITDKNFFLEFCERREVEDLSMLSLSFLYTFPIYLSEIIQII